MKSQLTVIEVKSLDFILEALAKQHPDEVVRRLAVSNRADLQREQLMQPHLDTPVNLSDPPGTGGWKKISALACLQCANYAVVCFSWRVVAQGNMMLSVFTDVFYSLLSYTVFREIAKGNDSWRFRVAYMLASGAGTAIGMVVSKVVTGK